MAYFGWTRASTGEGGQEAKATSWDPLPALGLGGSCWARGREFFMSKLDISSETPSNKVKPNKTATGIITGIGLKISQERLLSKRRMPKG